MSTIKLMCSNSMHGAMKALLPQFEQASGHHVDVGYDPAKLTLERVARGETADLIVLNTPALDELVRQGKIETPYRKLASCGVGVAVLAGAPKPDIGTVEAFKRALLNAKSVAYTGAGASGMHFAGLIEQLGIAADIKAKARIRPGGLIGELVASGEAELAIQQIPELRAVAGIDIVGPLPQALQSTSIIATTLFTGTALRVAAQALIDFLASPDAARVYAGKGLDPA